MVVPEDPTLVPPPSTRLFTPVTAEEMLEVRTTGTGEAPVWFASNTLLPVEPSITTTRPVVSPVPMKLMLPTVVVFAILTAVVAVVSPARLVTFTVPPWTKKLPVEA